MNKLKKKKNAMSWHRRHAATYGLCASRGKIKSLNFFSFLFPRHSFKIPPLEHGDSWRWWAGWPAQRGGVAWPGYATVATSLVCMICTYLE